MNENKSIKIDKSTYEKLKEHQKKTGATLVWTISHAVEDYLKKYDRGV